MRYAHIQDGKVWEIFSPERRRKPGESLASHCGMPEVMDIRPVGPEVDHHWQVDKAGVFSPPEPVDDDHASRARHALAASDRVVLRCYEAEIPVPGEWKLYRNRLRKVAATGKFSGDWPEPPPFPSS